MTTGDDGGQPPVQAVPDQHTVDPGPATATPSPHMPSTTPRRATSASPRLTSRLTGSQVAPLVLLHAHAGYGKTTCLESWQVVDPRPFAWLRCRPGHRDQRAFLGA